MLKNNFKTNIINKSKELGITDVRFSDAIVDSQSKENLSKWIELGYAANMQYIPNNIDKRYNPDLILENAKSIIVCSLYYYPGNHPKNESKKLAKISRYAQGIDYHYVFLEKVKLLEKYIKELVQEIKTKSFTDTGHILEKYFAQKSGIGWQGKNSLIISPKYGSYFFLGVILTDFEFESDVPIRNYCGNCVSCINACPTNALVEPYVLDTRACIAYWTVEAKPGEELPDSVKSKNSEWIFGCDICQEVCPYNKRLVDLTEVSEFKNPNNFFFDLDELSNFSKEEFNRRFKQSPIKRRKYEGFLKNADLLIQNSENKTKI